MTDTLDRIENSEKIIDEALSLMQKAIDLAKPEIFAEPETANNLDVLGILVSKYTEWDEADIWRVTWAALEDANFHEEAEKAADRYREITGDDPW